MKSYVILSKYFDTFVKILNNRNWVEYAENLVTSYASIDPRLSFYNGVKITVITLHGHHLRADLLTNHRLTVNPDMQLIASHLMYHSAYLMTIKIVC